MSSTYDCGQNGGTCDDCADPNSADLAEDGQCTGDDVVDDCVDTDNGATDSYGDGCDAYVNFPSWCGGYDDDDFNSADMCCACGGGSTRGRRDDFSGIKRYKI